MVTGAWGALTGLNHDSAIFFRAGLREWAGQTAYGDYYVPQGMVAGWVIGQVIPLFSTVGWGILWLTVGLNALATGVTWKIVYAVTHSVRHSAFAALLTALCYTPIMGAFYNDHLAYAFLLLAIWAIVGTTTRRALIAGGLCAVAFHTKQPVGVAGMVALVLGTLAVDRRHTLPVLLGFVLIFLGFIGMFLYQGVLENWFTYSIVYPVQFASRVRTPWAVFENLVAPWALWPPHWLRDPQIGQISFYAFALLTYLGWAVLLTRKLDRRVWLLLFVAIVSTQASAALLGRLHSQLFFGTGAVAAVVLWQSRQWRWTPWAAGLLTASAAVTLGLARLPLQLPHYVATDQLSPLVVRDAQDLSDTAWVVHELKKNPGTYALFCTQCYVVPLELGRAALSPPVYFEAGLTFPYYQTNLVAPWEQQMIRSLSSTAPKYLVLSPNWTKWDAQYPKLSSFIQTHYQWHRSGTFQRILIRRSPPKFGPPRPIVSLHTPEQ